ncbi:hypothetical protein GH866_29340 [Bacillus thuringiensis]|nr:hypothetical protein [Bacillus thuringiensis]
MNYKNRTNAKRKYKQTLFVTIATMTLGGSILGNTTSAFSAENTAEKQKVSSYLKNSDTVGSNVFKVAADGSVTLLNSNPFDSPTVKAITLLGGNLLNQAYLDAYKKDFTGTARTLVLGATALIPYVGSFISPVIGLLWPANIGTDMTAQTKALVALINEQIADYDIETLEQKGKTLKDLMSRFDDLLNGKPLTFGEQGTIQETLRNKASNINDKFIEVINDCQKRSFKAEELPIYTLIATAHLLFLNMIEQNGQSSRIQMDDETYKGYVEDFKRLPIEYANYIEATSKLGKQKFNTKMNDTINAAKKQALVGIISSDEKTNLENLEKTRKQCLDEAKLLQQMGDAYGAEKARQKAQKAYEYKKQYEDLIQKRDNYIKNTADNEAFKLAKTSMEELMIDVMIPNGKYIIQSVQNSNMVVGMSGNNIQLEDNNGQLNNKFVIIYDQARNSYVIETSVETGLSSYMAANIDYSNVNKSGVNVYAIPSISSHEQPDILHWKLKRARGSKFVYLENTANGQVLDVSNAGTEKGTNIITWPLKQQGQNQNQGFKLVPTN